jgi:hypothetical protein
MGRAASAARRLGDVITIPLMLRSALKERVSKHDDRNASFETPPSAAPQDEVCQSSARPHPDAAYGVVGPPQEGEV